MGFIDLKKAYDSVNREALWQGLKMYDVRSKRLSEIKRIYVDSSACVRVKGGKSELFRMDSGLRQGCIMSLWLFSVYMDAVKVVNMGMGRRGESGDYLASCMQMTWFCVMSRRRT